MRSFRQAVSTAGCAIYFELGLKLRAQVTRNVSHVVVVAASLITYAGLSLPV